MPPQVFVSICRSFAVAAGVLFAVDHFSSLLFESLMFENSDGGRLWVWLLRAAGEVSQSALALRD